MTDLLQLILPLCPYLRLLDNHIITIKTCAISIGKIRYFMLRICVAWGVYVKFLVAFISFRDIVLSIDQLINTETVKLIFSITNWASTNNTNAKQREFVYKLCPYLSYNE